MPSSSVPHLDPSTITDPVAESTGSTPASDYSDPDPSDKTNRAVVLPPGPSVLSSDRCEPSTPPSSNPPPTTRPSLSPPITPLSVSPCDSPSERMLLLGSPLPLTDTPVLPASVRRPPPPTTSAAPASPPQNKLPRGRSLVRRSCRSRNPVRSRDRSKLKKLNFSPRRPSRGRNQRQDIISGAVPGFGDPEIVWSNGEDDSPVVPVSSADCPAAKPHMVSNPSSVSEPSGPPSPPPKPYRLCPSDLPPNDLRRRIRGVQVPSLASSSPVMAPGASVIDDCEKKAYLAGKRVQLEQLKRVHFVNSGDDDRRVVWDSPPQDRRCVLLKDELTDDCQDPQQSSPVRPTDVDDTPPSNYSAPYSGPVPSPPSTPRPSSTNLQADPTTTVVSPDSAELNRVNALKILRATFRTADVVPPAPPPRRPSTSSVAFSTSEVTVTSSTAPRVCSEVAPPVNPTKRRLISRPSGAVLDHRTTSQALSSILHKLRPRPQSESDEDSCFDPRTPPPPSPVLSTNSDDEDCAVDVVNLECVQPRCPKSLAEDDDASIPPAQPCPDRPPAVVADPPDPPNGPPPTETEVDDLHDTSEELLMPPQELAQLTEFRNLWVERFTSEHSWDEFSQLCESFATEARSMAQSLSNPMAPTPAAASNPPPPPRPLPRPPPRRPPHARGFRPFNPIAARRLQGLYRHSKKRAARQLLCDTAVQYSGSISDAESYFEAVLDEKTCNTSLLAEALRADVPNATDDERTADLKSEVSEAEVAAKLRSAANTAPGADRVEYAHLKRIDPSAKILAPIFNTCLRAQNVPDIWKRAVTVLIYKKGDPGDVSNFRPIALMSCIYKLFMGIIAKRLTRWSIDAGILSEEQKCARPTEGCYEHTYILKSLVGQARRNKKKLCVAWLDIRNAFGSVPHGTIVNTLRHIGVPDPIVSLIMNAYTGASTTIKSAAGETRSIPIQAGVKQGCPLSPILFNLCIELILRRVKSAAAKLKSGDCNHYGTALSCLAYADDLVVVARSRAALQLLLDAASDAAHIVGLSFRPDKCASLSLTSTKQRATYVHEQDFLIQGNHIPALAQEQSYRYLGVPIGLVHNIDDLPNIVPQLTRHVEIIGNSLLAPWQKLDAIRSFVQPCLTYALRAGNPEMQSLDIYKSTLVRVLRDVCSLPDRSASSYFFASKRTGGFALQEPRTECDVQAIVQAVRILSSSDPAVATMARQELKYIVRRSTQSNPTPDLLSTYLSSLPDRRTDRLYYTYSSLWSRVRMACRRLRVSFHYSEQADEVSIAAEDSEPIKSRTVTTFLHRLVQSRFGDELMALRDQGKVARGLSNDLYGNGSTWHCTGLNISFKDWRFIHRARLNVVPLNANKSRFSNTAPTCRHCLMPETLPHVICHCRPHMVQIRDRHNAIVSRLQNSIRFGKITTDCTVKESNLRLRPDIVVEEDNRVLLIDVTCPFDNDTDALSDAAAAKIEKYAPLKEFLSSKGKSCEIFPFVVGALGSWYKQNELLLTRLGMTRRYKSLFRKLCCTDAIKGSNSIYRLHLGCDESSAPYLGGSPS